MTSMQIIRNESGEPNEFLGEQIAYADGEPYSDMDDYYEYAVYRRAEDNYFVCVISQPLNIKLLKLKSRLWISLVLTQLQSSSMHILEYQSPLKFLISNMDKAINSS